MIQYNHMREIKDSIERILKPTPDPFNIRGSTAEVVKQAQFVTINETRLTEFGEKLNKAVIRNELSTEAQFGHLENTPQKVFLLDTANFCFWSKKGKPRWATEYPPGTITNGWNALTACFDRALTENNIPLLDSQFLAEITLKQTQHIFRSHNSTQIPLLKERTVFLQEAGKILSQKFAGDFNNLVKQADYNAIKISRLIIEHFPSFKDIATVDGQQVSFFKRAQICSYDLSLLSQLQLTNLDQLTVFADYRLPQILRSHGVMHYEKPLANKIDNLKLIKPNSQEETEIRAATIWAGELLANRLKLIPAVIDNAIWRLAAQNKHQMKPHHRTFTTNY